MTEEDITSLAIDATPLSVVIMKYRVRAVLVTCVLTATLTPHPLRATPVDTSTAPQPTDSTIPIDTTTTITSVAPTMPRKAKVVYRVPTRDKVVFITIDDGFTTTPALADVIRRHKVPVTTFAMPRVVERQKKWYLSQKNMTFENHTVNHRSLTFLSLRSQKREICGANTQLKKTTGESPRFFRPPGGNFTQVTRRAVAQCGMKYIVMWNVIAEKNTLRIPAGRLNRGDIILMHYLPSTASTLELLLAQIKKNGLRPALLRDYLD